LPAPKSARDAPLGAVSAELALCAAFHASNSTRPLFLSAQGA
jgi:hypothetical protein